jgi:hypothetical protein
LKVIPLVREVDDVGNELGNFREGPPLVEGLVNDILADIACPA